MSYSAVTSNVGKRRFPGASTDFPLYLPRALPHPQELKYVDSTIFGPFSRAKPSGGPTPVDYLYLVPLPTAGDGLSLRLSDRIKLIGLVLRGTMFGPEFFGGNVPLTLPVEYFLIYDRSPGPTRPLAREVFTQESISTGSGLLQLPDSRDRFQILYRFRYVLGAKLSASPTGNPEGFYFPALPPGSPDHVIIDENLSINQPTSFKFGGGATYDQISAGALYIYASGSTYEPFDEELPQRSFPGWNVNLRLLFADL